MGRAKLPIKKIENTTNRQVTFSKRRNGIIKKAYELSVLCDVDVALIMFSPSGKASIFAGRGSIEEIITRYIHVPEHERGRLRNKEYLERVLGKLRSEAQEHQAQKQARDNSASGDSQLEELQQEINWCKSHMVEMEKKIRVYEGDASEISTVSEAEDREKILEEALKQVHVRKHVLKKYNSADAQSSSQAALTLGTVNVNNMVTSNPSNIFDWLPPREPQVQIVNFLNFGGLLSPRRNEHVTRGSVMEPDNVQRAEFGQMLDMNLSSWALSYPTGNVEMGMLHAGDRVFDDAFLP